MKTYLGIELGSTRIKVVAIDEKYNVVNKGEYGWKSEYIDGVWTYSLDEACQGINAALKQAVIGIDVNTVSVIGVSGMMHGYLAFDKDWNLLAPFRTWQCTVTEQAASILTEKFKFNVPQRWSAAHLYQAILNKEPHTKNVAHITTLAGYVHYMLTGVNAVGIGEASGMFPIDSETKTYDAGMVKIYNELLKEKGYSQNIVDLLPEPLIAGSNAGTLKNTNIISDLLPSGIRFAPPEGDMQTGMIATNSVARGTGNISAGTAFNLTLIIGKGLKKVYPEIDIITTPTGDNAALIHANNGSNDINAWFSVLKETAELFGGNTEDIYTKLFEYSLQGDADCDGITVYNYMAGEPITHINEGKPIVIRRPDSHFTLANFVRAQLYGSMATMRIGIEILSDEKTEISRITGHGGFFKTAHVAQKYMAAACNAPIFCNNTAGEGGPFGMALLAAYLDGGGTLDKFLNTAFGSDSGTVVKADRQTQNGFDRYMAYFKQRLAVERKAGEIK